MLLLVIHNAANKGTESDKAMFDELLASVEEMDAISQGQKEPARTMHFPEPQVQAIRDTTGVRKRADPT